MESGETPLLPKPTNSCMKHNISNIALENFGGVFVKLAETHPNTPLTPEAKIHVEARLKQFFSEYKTPHHPPYPAMIKRAILELNEKGGSSEDSISKFLQKEYKDALPLPHSMILNYHLNKLCQSGYIFVRLGKRYMLVRN